MKIEDEIRHRVVIARLEQLQREHDSAMARLKAEKKLATWIDWEMSELWIEKAALERKNGYPPGMLFT